MAKRNLLAAYKETHTALKDLADIVKAPDQNTAWSIVEKICADCGFDYAGVGIIAPTETEVSITLAHATPFFAESFGKYHRRNLHVHDPAAHQLAQGTRMINAEDSLKAARRSMSEGARKVKAHFSEDGIAGHAAMRVDMPGRPFASFLSIGYNDRQSSGEFREAIRQNANLLLMAAAAYTSIALRDRVRIDEAPIISRRETQVLQYLALGLSPQEIAEQENKSLATIRHQIASAKQRLGARSSAHAVAIALELDLIRF